MDCGGNLRVLVIGDSDVGKSSFVHLICRGEPREGGGYTVGCNPEVLMRTETAGSPSGGVSRRRPNDGRFVEFWDVGGSKHVSAESRALFYRNIDAVVLVFDVTNPKSYHNLRQWMAEVVRCQNDPNAGVLRCFGEGRHVPLNRKQFVERCPCLVVGNKCDCLPGASKKRGDRSGGHGVSDISWLSRDSLRSEYNAELVLASSLSPSIELLSKVEAFCDDVASRRGFRSANDARSRSSNGSLPKASFRSSATSSYRRSSASGMGTSGPWGS